MNDRDWDFAIGNLGDPLADIEPWMTPPHPAWVTRKEAAHGSNSTGSNTQTTEPSPRQ